LPVAVTYFQIIEVQDGGVVVIGGLQRETVYQTLYQLPHGGPNAAWTKMKQYLKVPRYWHTSFLIPDNIVDCS
jgi:hypothetical protein